MVDNLDNRMNYPSGSFASSTPDVDEDLFDYYYDQQESVPGTLNIKEDALPTKIVLIDYNETNATRVSLSTPEDCAPYLDSESVSWVDVQGLASSDILEGLDKVFDLHPFVLEDVVDVLQRPKINDFKDQMLLIAHVVTPEREGRGFVIQQVSFALGRHYLLTVQEEPNYDCFGLIRDQIRTSSSSIRNRGADFLAYALLAAIVDSFFAVLETYEELLEELEDEVEIAIHLQSRSQKAIFKIPMFLKKLFQSSASDPSQQVLQKVNTLRKDLLYLRRVIWPQRNVFNFLIQNESFLITDDVRMHFRNLYDRTSQILDTVELHRQKVSQIQEQLIGLGKVKTSDIRELLATYQLDVAKAQEVIQSIDNAIPDSPEFFQLVNSLDDCIHALSPHSESLLRMISKVTKSK